MESVKRNKLIKSTMTLLWHNCLLRLLSFFWQPLDSLRLYTSHAIMLINYPTRENCCCKRKTVRIEWLVAGNVTMCTRDWANEPESYGMSSSLFRYFTLRLSNNIISYDWSNSTTETQKPAKKVGPGNSFSIFNKPFKFWYVSCVSLLCLFIRQFFCSFLFCAPEKLEEFMMVHFLSINFGWFASANFNTTFD